jgi:hypothetical protein
MALTRRQKGDTSPLRGLAYGNSPFAYANVFAASSLRCFCAQRGGIPVRVCEPVDSVGCQVVCALFETVVASQLSPPVGEQGKQDFTRRPSAERLPAEAGRSRAGPDLKENGAYRFLSSKEAVRTTHLLIRGTSLKPMGATRKDGSRKQLLGQPKRLRPFVYVRSGPCEIVASIRRACSAFLTVSSA